MQIRVLKHVCIAYGRAWPVRMLMPAWVKGCDLVDEGPDSFGWSGAGSRIGIKPLHLNPVKHSYNTFWKEPWVIL